MGMIFSNADLALLEAAASLATHAPEPMRAAHMAPALRALGGRIRAQIPRDDLEAEPEVPLLRAA